jgi:hypothetical protein
MRTAQRLCYAELAQQQCQEREHLPDLGKALADKFVGGRSLLNFVTRTVLHKFWKSAIVILRGVKNPRVPVAPS